MKSKKIRFFSLITVGLFAVLLASCNPYLGPQDVAEGMYARIGQDLETVTLTDQNLYRVENDIVLVTGRY